MATTSTSIAFLPILFFGVISVVIAVAIISSSRQTRTNTTTKHGASKFPAQSERRYTFAPLNQYYVPTGLSPQMELDLRLPYRRWKQLYPHSTLTYDEYKKMQNQKAFKRSFSSQKNRRMVR